MTRTATVDGSVTQRTRKMAIDADGHVWENLGGIIDRLRAIPPVATERGRCFGGLDPLVPAHRVSLEHAVHVARDRAT